jgi:HPt (histidine-containing phosphotransfer) domain-containing protein
MVNKQDFFNTYSNFEKSILIEIIDIFKDEAPEKVRKLYDDAAAKNLESLRFDAHSLKGTIGSFCAPKAWAMAKDFETKITQILEKNGEGFSEDQIIMKIGELEEAVKIMISQLKEIKKEIIQQ